MAEEEKPEEGAAGVVEGEEGAEGKVSLLKKLLKPPLLFIAIGVLVVILAVAGFFLFAGKKKPPPKLAGDAKTEEAASDKKSEEKEAPAEEKPAPEKSDEKKDEKKDEKHEASKKEASATEGVEGGGGGETLATFKLEPMVVNIPDKNTIHYLKFQLEVAASAPEVVEEMQLKMSQLKDALLFIASDKSLRELMTSGGKNLLKDDIQDSFNKLLKKGTVKELYFTEFTIQ